MIRFLLAFLVAPLTLSGCAANSSHNDVVQSVKAVTSLSHCGLTAPGLVLAQGPGDWRKLSDIVGSQIPAWPGEPGRWMLVAAMGQKRTGGYGVGFSEATMDGSELVIDVSVSSPAPDAMVTQALTTPCLIVALPSTGWETVTVTGDAPFPMSRKHP